MALTKEQQYRFEEWAAKIQKGKCQACNTVGKGTTTYPSSYISNQGLAQVVCGSCGHVNFFAISAI